MKKHIIGALVLSLLITGSVSMTGCGNKKSEPVGNIGKTDSTETEFNIDWVMASVNSNDDVEISISDHEQLNGSSSVVNGSDVSGNLAGQVETFADFGDSYLATYDIKSDHLETATFTLTPKGEKSGDTLYSYGINYFEVVQEVATVNCESVSVKYKDITSVKSQKGKFEITLYPASKDTADELGYGMILITGDTGDETADITVTMEDGDFTGFTFDSNISMDITVKQYADDRYIDDEHALIDMFDDTSGFQYVAVQENTDDTEDTTNE